MPRERREIPWLEKRTDGTYYVYWYENPKQTKADKRRRSTGTRDPVEAQKFYAWFLAGGQEEFKVGQPNGLTVNAALDDYKREHVEVDVVDKTRANNAIRNLKAWFKDTLVKDIDIPLCRAYAKARREGSVHIERKRSKKAVATDSTIRRELGVLNAAIEHAVRWKRLARTDQPKLEKPAEAVQEEPVWLTQEELKRVLDTATGRLKDFLTLLYYTGARRRSIEKLTRFQINLVTGRINLSSPKETPLERRSVKRRPIVPIMAEMRPTVERLMEENKDSEYLFGDPLDMYRRFHDHLVEQNLADKSFPHVMRHSRATHLLQDGVDIYAVARLLGDTVATIERVYGHHSAEYMAEAIEQKRAKQ